MEDRFVRYRWEESDSKISGFENGKQYQFLNICMLVRKKLMETITDDELQEIYSNVISKQRDPRCLLRAGSHRIPYDKLRLLPVFI